MKIPLEKTYPSMESGRITCQQEKCKKLGAITQRCNLPHLFHWHLCSSKNLKKRKTLFNHNRVAKSFILLFFCDSIADSPARFTQRHFFKSGSRHFIEPNPTLIERHSTRRRKFSSLLNLEWGGRLKLTLHLRQVGCQVIDCLSCRFQILTHFQCIYTTLCCKG